MPTTLTGDETSFPPQTTPVGGEARTASSVATPFQNSADRTAHLKARLDYIDPSKSGVRRRRRFGSIAEMKASTDLSDGTIAQIDGIGCYMYMASSSLVAAEPVIVTPTDVGGGPGRWVHDVYGTLNVANGTPQLDSNGKVPTSLLAAAIGGKIQGASIANGVVARAFNTVPGTFNVPNDATTRDVTGTLVTFSGLLANDVIDIDFTPNANPKSAPTYLYFSVRVIKPGPSNDDGPELLSAYLPNGLEVDNKRPFPVKRFHTCLNPGDYSVVLRVRGTATNTNGAVDGVHVRIQVTRD